MARGRNNRYDRAEMLADWKTGNFSERALADKHNVSAATAHNVVRGVGKEIQALVSEQVAINQKLTNFSEQEVSRFDKEVSEKTKYMLLVNESASRNIVEAMEAPCENQNDFKNRADTILKSKDAFFGKDPVAAVQVNIGTIADALRNADRLKAE